MRHNNNNNNNNNNYHHNKQQKGRNRNGPQQNHVFHGRIQRQQQRYQRPNFHHNNNNNNNHHNNNNNGNNSIHSRLSMPFPPRQQQPNGNCSTGNGRRRHNNNYHPNIFKNGGIKEKKTELCKFHVTEDGCMFDQCNYMHEEFPCKYHFIQGFCPDRANCRLNHNDPLTEEMKEVLITHVEKAPNSLIGEFPRFNRSKCQTMIQQIEQREKHKQTSTSDCNLEFTTDAPPNDFGFNSLNVDNFSFPISQTNPATAVKTQIIKKDAKSKPTLCRTINNTNIMSVQTESSNQLDTKTSSALIFHLEKENSTIRDLQTTGKPTFHTVIESMKRLLMKHRQGFIQCLPSASSYNINNNNNNDKSNSCLIQNSTLSSSTPSTMKLNTNDSTVFGSQMNGDAKVVIDWQDRTNPFYITRDRNIDNNDNNNINIISPMHQIPRSPFIRSNDTSPNENKMFNGKNTSEVTFIARKSVKDRLGGVYANRDSSVNIFKQQQQQQQKTNPCTDKTNAKLDYIIKSCTADPHSPTCWEYFSMYLKCLEDGITVSLFETSPL